VAEPLGLEFAQLFSRFGTKVTVLTHGERTLSHEEAEISIALAGYLEEEGIDIHTRVEANSTREENVMKTVEATVDGEELTFIAEEFLIAVGVRANNNARGLIKITIDELIDTVHIFPTLSEGIKMATQAFRRDITKMSCCVE
jgi:mercuric reductase